MTLDDLLALDRNQTSIKKIDLFISSCNKYSPEYTKAVCLKAEVLHNIKKTNDALKLVYSLVPNFNDFENESIVEICSAIINICLDINRLDQVKKYMLIKKRFLPVSQKNLYLKDEIALALKEGNTLEAKNVLVEYLSDDLTKDEQIFAKDNLASIYYSTKDYSSFLEVVKDLEDYYQTKLNFVKLTELILKRINAYYNTSNYLRVIMDGNNYLRDYKLKDEDRLYIATRIILSYIACSDYKKASIIESDYEELLDNVDDSHALEFSKAALELYTKTNSLVSIKTYQERVKKYGAVEKNLKSKKEKVVDYQIPIIQEADISEISPNEDSVLFDFKDDKSLNVTAIKNNYKKIENVIVSDNYEKLSNVFNVISKASLSNKFREVYRLGLIEANKLFKFSESYILYYSNGYKGLYYKKERVYDKRLEFCDIENTLNFITIDKELEAFLDEDSSYNIDIVTKKEYAGLKYGISFPLTDSEKIIGSIAFFSEERFLDKEMTYESLKLISAMLNIALNNYLKQQRLEYENRKLYYLSSNLPFITKEQSNGFIHLIGKDNFLDLPDDLDEEVFFNRIKPSDLPLYKKQLDFMLESIDSDICIEYDFKVKDKYIRLKELMYPLYQEGTFIICSVIENIDKYERVKEELTNLAYQNPVTKLNTEVKLMVDLDKVFQNRKASLAIFKINNFSYYVDIYGYNFSNQLIYTVGTYFNEYFKNDFNISVYHLSHDMFSILINNINDKRVIDSRLNEAFDTVASKIFTLNSRVKLTITCGVYRLNKNSTINSSSKLFGYALDALNDATSDENSSNTIISHFDSENHKNKFNEKQLVTHISEAIDHGRLGVAYQQIVNLKDKEVIGYMARLSLDNYEVDRSFMDYVINRRGLGLDMKKYLISNSIKEQKEFKDKTKGKLIIFLEVNEYINDELIKFINAQITFFKYFENNLVFIVDSYNSEVAKLKEIGYKIASKNLVDLINDKVDYLFYDIKNLINVKEIKDLLSKHSTTLIVDNVNTKEDISFIVDNGFDNCFGSFYKKGLRLKKIIEKVI